MKKINVHYVRAGDDLEVPKESIIHARVMPPRMGMTREEKTLEIWCVEGKSTKEPDSE